MAEVRPADFLALVEQLAARALPAPLRGYQVGATDVSREFRFADAPALRVVLEVVPPKIVTGIALEGPVGERVFANLKASESILKQTLGKGLQMRGSEGARWIGETQPLGRADRRVAQRVAGRLAAYILYFKPMMDDLGTRA